MSFVSTTEPLEAPERNTGLRSVRETRDGTRMGVLVAIGRPSRLRGFVRRSESVWAWLGIVAIIAGLCWYAVAQWLGPR